MNGSDSSTQEFQRNAKISLFDLTCITSITRSLKLSTQEMNLVQEGVAHVGSIVICEVLSVGAHEKLEDRSGRYARIAPGDLIMGVMGNRQSTISMYGGLPESGVVELPREEPVDLLSSGGVIGICELWPSYRGSPTKLRVLGLASQGGKLLEITPQFRDKHLHISCPLILIVGTSAAVGKTRFASKLIHYMVHNLGRHVASTKLAGAGNLDDLLSLRDSGATPTFDYVDAGLVNTYGIFGDLVVEVAKGVLNHLGEEKPDAIIAELCGDILGANVPAILADPEIRDATLAMILVPSDIMAAYGAFKYLKEKMNFPAQIYFSPPFEKNQMASQRRAWQIIDRRLYDCENPKDLEDLIEEVLGWRGQKDDQLSQIENPGTAEEQRRGHPTTNAEIFHRSDMLEELTFTPFKSLSG